MKITPAVQASHRDLSPISERFLDFAAEHPQTQQKVDFVDSKTPEWIRALAYPMQTWPTFVGQKKLDQIQQATVGVSRLVKLIPERIFEMNAEKVAHFFGLDNPMLVAMHLEPPHGLEEGLARGDYIDNGNGFYCLEVNLAAFIGGWQIRFWQDLYRSNPIIARFLEEENLNPGYHDPLVTLLQFLIDQSEPIGNGTVNLAFAISREGHDLIDQMLPTLNRIYSQILDRQGLEGQIQICSYPHGLTTRRGYLYNGSTQIHAVVEYTADATPPDVYRCFKAGTVKLFNSPLCAQLSNKRSIALLSAHENSDLFTKEERQIIRDHIPWSRDIQSGNVEFEGESNDLVTLLENRQQDFVIKASDGAQGRDVYIGRYTEPTVWKHQIQVALGEPGRWITQQAVRSRPYLYQEGDCGMGVHDVVWGMFCFGDRFAGGFLRLIPQNTHDGVINSARGATEGFIFEV